LCRMIDIGTWNILFLSIVVFIWALYLVNKLAPVDSTSKPIKNEKNRKRLKINSIKILIIYFIICLCNIICYQFNSNSKLVTYTLCISLGMTWQVFTLTKIGHIIVVKFDGLF
jgi:accessory gene regulator B